MAKNSMYSYFTVQLSQINLWHKTIANIQPIRLAMPDLTQCWPYWSCDWHHLPLEAHCADQSYYYVPSNCWVHKDYFLRWDIFTGFLDLTFGIQFSSVERFPAVLMVVPFWLFLRNSRLNFDNFFAHYGASDGPSKFILGHQDALFGNGTPYFSLNINSALARSSSTWCSNLSVFFEFLKYVVAFIYDAAYLA